MIGSTPIPFGPATPCAEIPHFTLDRFQAQRRADQPTLHPCHLPNTLESDNRLLQAESPCYKLHLTSEAPWCNSLSTGCKHVPNITLQCIMWTAPNRGGRPRYTTHRIHTNKSHVADAGSSYGPRLNIHGVIILFVHASNLHHGILHASQHGPAIPTDSTQ